MQFFFCQYTEDGLFDTEAGKDSIALIVLFVKYFNACPVW